MGRLPRLAADREFADLLAQLDEIDTPSVVSETAVEVEEMETELRLTGTIGGIGLALRQVYGDGGSDEDY